MKLRRKLGITGLMVVMTIGGMAYARQVKISSQKESSHRHITASGMRFEIYDSEEAVVNSLQKRTKRPIERRRIESVSLEDGLYGYLTYTRDPEHRYDRVGLNKIGTDGAYENIWSGEDMQACFVHDGKVCGTQLVIFWDELYGAYYEEYDLSTGDKLASVELDPTNKCLFVTASYYPGSDEIYGYAYNDDLSDYNFVRIDAANPGGEGTVIRENVGNDMCMSMTYNEYEDLFYGMNNAGNLVEIDRAGNQRIVMKSPVGSFLEYRSGLTYKPSTQSYIFNKLTDDGCSMWEMTPSTGKSEKLHDLPYFEEFVDIFYVGENKDVPQRPEVVDQNFVGPAQSGSVTWTLPDKMESGNAITGNVNWTVFLDGESYKTGIGDAGSNIKIDFSNLENGFHTLSLSTKLPDGTTGKRSNVFRYIGNDIPKAPSNVVFTPEKISWDAVTAGENNGYINVGSIQYEVTLDGNVIATTSNLSVATGLNSTAEMKRHYVSVRAVCNSQRSKASETKSLVTGKPFTPDVTFAPTAEEAELFDLIDGNNDTWPWMFDEYDEAFVHGRSESYNWDLLEDADDWIIFPAITFTKGNIYCLSIDVNVDESYYEDIFEIRIGRSQNPDEMTSVLLEPTTVNNDEPRAYSTYFDVPENDVYYLAVHCVSIADDQGDLFIRNMSVNKTGDINGPAVPMDVVAVGGAKGALNAEVSFKMPSTTFAGKQLESSTIVYADLIAGENEKVTISGHPGETVKATVPTSQGDNLIKIMPYFSNGLKGCPTSVTVFTGVDVPAMPENFKMVVDETNMTARFTWDAPTEGINGRYVDPDKIIYRFDWGYWTEVFPKEVIGTGITEYTLTLPENTMLDYHAFVLSAEDPEGNSDGYAITFAQMGKVYDMPLKENFANNEYHHWPIGGVEEDPGFSYWRLYRSNTESGYVLQRDCGYYGKPIYAALPKFSTKDCNVPALKISVLCGEENCTYEILATTSSSTDRITLGTIEGDGWVYSVIELPEELKDQNWVEILIKASPTIPEESYVDAAIDFYEISEWNEYDFKLASLTVPERMVVGQPSTINALVQNSGRSTAALPEMSACVTKRNESHDLRLVSALPETIESGNSVELKFEYIPTADDLGSVKVSIELDEDGEPADNLRSATSTCVAARQNVVTDLYGERTDNGTAHLTWSAPLSKSPVSFEDEVFAQNVNEISGFINIDADGKQRYPFWHFAVPGSGSPAAWMVWDKAALDDLAFGVYNEPFFLASDGKKALVANCPEDGTPADDWLISPRVKPGSNVRFMVRTMEEQYGAESLELLVSSSDTEMASFKKIKDVTVESDKYMYIETVLPGDAKYFAIRYTSEDKYGVYLDEISFEADSSDVASYEIYRDGVAVGTSTSAEYTDNVPGAFLYNVVPIMHDGKKGLMSNTYRFGSVGVNSVYDRQMKNVFGGKGLIHFNSLQGMNATVIDLNGQIILSEVVHTNDYDLPINSGVYIVQVNGMIEKVVVR